MNGNLAKDYVTEHWKQNGREIQKWGDVVEDLPHPLRAKVAALQVEVQHFPEKMLYGTNVSTTES